MKRHAKSLIKDAEHLGYQAAGVNSKGFRIYRHECGHEVLISPGISEYMARDTLRDMKAAVGIDEPPVAKRNADAIRRRSEQERERAAADEARSREALGRLVAHKERMLAGHASQVSAVDVLAIEAQIEREERDLARYRRLMTELPSPADRRVRHRAGAQ